MVIYKMIGDLVTGSLHFLDFDKAVDYIKDMYKDSTRTMVIEKSVIAYTNIWTISMDDGEDGGTIDSTGTGDQLKIFYHAFVIEEIKVIC